MADLQRHADRRARMKGLNGKLSSATIKKEPVTLRTVWNGGESMGLVAGMFPRLKQVRLAKPEEKPTFQTRKQFQQQIAARGCPTR